AGLSGQDAITKGQRVIVDTVTPEKVKAGQDALQAIHEAGITLPGAASAAAAGERYANNINVPFTRASVQVQWLEAQEGTEAYEWSQPTVTVSFPNVIPTDHAADEDFAAGWQSVPTQWRAAWLSAMQQALAPININLQGVDSDGDIRIALGALDSWAYGWANYPDVGLGGDLQIKSAFAFEQAGTINKTNYLSTVLVHELGHAMGLKHPFEDDPVMPAALDSQLLSIMSYTSAPDLWPTAQWALLPGGRTEVTSQYDQVFRSDYGIADLAVLTVLYGANKNHHAGNTTYTLAPPSPSTWAYSTLSDASGTDTLDLTVITRGNRIDMRPGTLSDVAPMTPEAWAEKLYDEGMAYYQAQGFAPAWLSTWVSGYVQEVVQRAGERLWNGQYNLGVAYGTVIENLRLGGGDDTVRDNAANNIIDTGAGNDTVYLLGGGWDAVYGNAGTDVVVIPSLAAATVQRHSSASAATIIINSGAAAVLRDVEYIADTSGNWTALSDALVGVAPKIAAWSDGPMLA
ncbi:matrixin, partial [Tepidimonas ignava]